jgi:hypothetical protein
MLKQPFEMRFGIDLTKVKTQKGVRFRPDWGTRMA